MRQYRRDNALVALLLTAATARVSFLVQGFLQLQHAAVLPHVYYHAGVDPRLRNFELQVANTADIDETEDTAISSIAAVGDSIGSGSYGTVHFLQMSSSDKRPSATDNDGESPLSFVSQWFIGKRPWTQVELEEQYAIVAASNTKPSSSKSGSSNNNNKKKEDDSSINKQPSPKEFQDRVARCLYYWQVEEHCFSKLPKHPQIPPYYGRFQRDIPSSSSCSGGGSSSRDSAGDKEEWMVFGIVGEENDYNNNGDSDSDSNNRNVPPQPALSLSDNMKLDMEELKSRSDNVFAGYKQESWNDDDGDNNIPQLRNLGRALLCDTDGETLDKALDSLLNVLAHVHSHQIVHRDIKPSNLLVHNGTLILLDFGSAADLEPSKSKGGGFFGGGRQQLWGLEDGNRVAVSPIYCAPEVFVDVRIAPLAFDLFSSGLLFCQLLLGYLEERVDAGFHQQLQDAKWDLNAWLSNEMASKLRPDGLERALDYLGERPGLWSLLQGLLEADPTRRPTAAKAQARLAKILEDRTANAKNSTYDKIATIEDQDGPFFAMILEAMESCELPAVSRPLHFVATFARSKPLGLVFAEVDAVVDKDDDLDASMLWSEATKDAMPGEVFVKEIVPGGQADELSIFEIGDRLQGIGELPFSTGGFERAVEMLQDQPRMTQNVVLHFDRLRARDNNAVSIVPSLKATLTIMDQGVWSTRGKRQTQEDAFVLHEIHDTKERSVLLLGVMDGHGGTAASKKVSTELPDILTNQIVVQRRPLEQALLYSWEWICQAYHQQCTDEGECVADYDAREGFLQANTGSEDLIAGTTASMMALDEINGELVTLNCGDSRSLVVTVNGKVQFVTKDHTPQTEEQRLLQGVAVGLDYSLPECKVSKWTISAGRYEYSVGRSLEGPFVTSKGIVSDADVAITSVGPGEILMSATDGLWEVMDSDEVAQDLYKMRHQHRMVARDAARSLCSMALKKGTSDNVSVVVVYL